MKLHALLIAVILTSGMLFATNNNDGDDSAPATEAKTIRINGHVQDFSSGEALPGVEVTIKDSKKKVYTDFDGKFSFKDITPGTYSIEVSYISYSKSYVEEITIKGDETLSIRLKDL